MAGSQSDQLNSSSDEEWIAGNNEGIDPLLRKSSKHGINILFVVGRYDIQ